MPRYRVLSELDPGDPQRDSRGKRLRLDEARLETVVVAGSLAEAACDARATGPHHERRIVAVEEVHPGFAFTDEEITKALTSTMLGEPLLPASFDAGTGPIYGNRQVDIFLDVVEAVAERLREAGLVPGLSVSAAMADYAMVEVLDDCRGIYLSVVAELSELTDNRDAVGWDGVIAIGRALVRLSNILH